MESGGRERGAVGNKESFDCAVKMKITKEEDDKLEGAILGKVFIIL